jgi:hypothetical protein
MVVYVAFKEHEFESRSLLGVFDSKEKAMDVVEKELGFGYFKEVELDQPMDYLI